MPLDEGNGRSDVVIDISGLNEQQCVIDFPSSQAPEQPDDTWLAVQGKESITNMGREQPTANRALLQLNIYLAL